MTPKMEKRKILEIKTPNLCETDQTKVPDAKITTPHQHSMTSHRKCMVATSTVDWFLSSMVPTSSLQGKKCCLLDVLSLWEILFYFLFFHFFLLKIDYYVIQKTVSLPFSPPSDPHTHPLSPPDPLPSVSLWKRAGPKTQQPNTPKQDTRRQGQNLQIEAGHSNPV